MNRRLEKYEITRATEKDIPFLSGIELAAAALLVGHAPDSVLLEVTSVRDLHEALTRDHLWVALKDDLPVGFALLEVLEPNAVHLREIDVHPDHGRLGIGTCLICNLCDWAARHDYEAITLTTFREVPWNMPFYERLGFRKLSVHELSPALIDVLRLEAFRGLDVSRRVAMRRELDFPPARFDSIK